MTDYTQLRKGDRVSVTVMGEFQGTELSPFGEVRMHLLDGDATVSVEWERNHAEPEITVITPVFRSGDFAEFKDGRNNTVRAMVLSNGSVPVWICEDGAKYNLSHLPAQSGFTVISRSPEV